MHGVQAPQTHVTRKGCYLAPFPGIVSYGSPVDGEMT